MNSHAAKAYVGRDSRDDHRMEGRLQLNCWGGCPRLAGIVRYQRSAVVALSKGEPMSDVHVLAIDLAKRSFQVCGTDRGGAVLFNRALSRSKLMQLLDAQPPCQPPPSC